MLGCFLGMVAAAAMAGFMFVCWTEIGGWFYGLVGLFFAGAFVFYAYMAALTAY